MSQNTKLSYQESVDFLENKILAGEGHPYTYLLNSPRGRAHLDEAIALCAKYGRERTVFDIVEDEEIRAWGEGEELIGVLGFLMPLWLDVEAVKNSPRNLLLNPANGEGWQAGYRNALATYLAEHAEPASLPENYFGWQDYSLMERLRENPMKVVAVTDVFTDSWSEFMGTDADSYNGHGVGGVAVYEDGTVRKLRWEGEFTDLVQSFTEKKRK
jgi:hypothetical protein